MNNSEKSLSIEEIMQKIKEEVEKRKSLLNSKSKIENSINKLGFKKKVFITQNQGDFIQKDVYEYKDFTKYNGKEFIRNVYKGLLKREPDVEGFNYYLNLLKSGQKSKMEIISLIRFSKEGKEKNVKLLGAKKRYLITKLFSLPFVGNGLKSIYYLYKLPQKTIQQEYYINEIDNKYFSILNNAQNKINKLFNNLKNIIKELNEEINKIDQELGEKAEQDDITHLEAKIEIVKKNIERNIERKLNEEINKINQELREKAEQDDITHLEAKIETVKKNIERNIERKLNEEINIPDQMEENSEDFINFAFSRLNFSLDELQNFKSEDLYYLLFENVFYNHEIVKKKQKIYLPYIKEVKIKNNENLKWLDIGCGRGEFLNILKENNINACGVEINTLEYNLLKKEGFEVYNKDVVSFLKNTQEKFIGISALQVIEHLDIDYLKQFIKLSFDKIVKNGLIILETINPYNSLAFGGFYMDETHKKPLPPYMMVFILQYYGFKDVKILFQNPLSKEIRRKDMRFNYYDYAVIGYKK